MGKVIINFEEIPPVERRNLARVFLRAVEQFYENPENRQAFEEWQKKQEAEQCRNGQ